MLLVNRQLIAETVLWCFSLVKMMILPHRSTAVYMSVKFYSMGQLVNTAGKKLVWGWVAMDHEVYGSGWGWIGAGTGDPIPMQASSSN